MDVRLIAAVGRSGQIGYGGYLPWHLPSDMRWFRETTMGGVVVVGRKTHARLPNLSGRDVVIWNGRGESAEEFLKAIEFSYPGRTIWIAGGAKTYQAFLNWAEWRGYSLRCFLNLVAWDEQADTWMPNLWNARFGR